MKLKNYLLVNCLLTAMILFFNHPVQAAIYRQELTINFSGGQETVHMVCADLNDKNIQVDSVLADGKVGHLDYLGNISQELSKDDRELVAAINGSYFDAEAKDFTTLWSTLQQEGDFVHTGDFGSVIAFSGDNQAIVDRIKIDILGSVASDDNKIYEWKAWGLNHLYDNPQAVSILTPKYGVNTGQHNFNSIVVKHGYVTEIKKGAAEIPSNGFTIVSEDETLLKLFKPAYKAAYKLQISRDSQNCSELIPWNHIRTTIGAGPLLLKNGQVVVDPKAEGFKDEELINKVAPFRSFIGVRKDHTLVMGTVKMLTIPELAEILQKIGLDDAINLDGGLSSSLYYNGEYLTGPFRKVSDAIVISRLKNPPIRLQLNGTEVFFDAGPLKKDGVIFLPMRKIFEELGAEIEYDPENKTIKATRYDFSLELKIASQKINLNGLETKLTYPVEVYQQRSYLSLNFIENLFNGSSKWSEDDNMIVLKLN